MLPLMNKITKHFIASTFLFTALLFSLKGFLSSKRVTVISGIISSPRTLLQLLGSCSVIDLEHINNKSNQLLINHSRSWNPEGLTT